MGEREKRRETRPTESRRLGEKEKKRETRPEESRRLGEREKKRKTRPKESRRLGEREKRRETRPTVSRRLGEREERRETRPKEAIDKPKASTCYIENEITTILTLEIEYIFLMHFPAISSIIDGDDGGFQ